MPVATIQHPNGRTFKLGRNKPSPEQAMRPKLRLSNYLLDTLPAPPKVCHYSYEAEKALANPYRNLDIGDCVVAGAAHVVGVWSGNAGGPPITFTDQQITHLYSQIGGYRGTEATDNGCDEQTMLDYWQKTGFVGHRIDGWMKIDAAHLDTAVWLFQNAIFGVCMPDAWVNPPPEKTGFVWDVAGPPVEQNGHCFVAVGYNAVGYQIATWGLIGTITRKAAAKYTSHAASGELYVAISQEAINRATHKAPNGVDWPGLTADFAQLGGSLDA